MDGYNIQRADNGWVVSWEEEMDDCNGAIMKHLQVFEVVEDTDDNKEDPQALMDLLYFVKDDICGQYFSKHKMRNIVIKFEECERE